MEGAFKAPYFQYLLLPPPPPRPRLAFGGYGPGLQSREFRCLRNSRQCPAPALSLSASCLLPVKAAWAPGSQLGPTALSSFLSLPTSLYLHIQF